MLTYIAKFSKRSLWIVKSMWAEKDDRNHWLAHIDVKSCWILTGILVILNLVDWHRFDVRRTIFDYHEKMMLESHPRWSTECNCNTGSTVRTHGMITSQQNQRKSKFVHVLLEIEFWARNIYSLWKIQLCEIFMWYSTFSRTRWSSIYSNLNSFQAD